MSSFQGIGIGVLLVYRGVPVSGGWNRGVPLYTEVSSFLGVGIEGFYWYTVVSSFQGVGIEEPLVISACFVLAMNIELLDPDPTKTFSSFNFSANAVIFFCNHNIVLSLLYL